MPKYGLGLLLALSAGTLIGVRVRRRRRSAQSIGDVARTTTRCNRAWTIVRWPLALAAHDGRRPRCCSAGAPAATSRRWSLAGVRRRGVGAAVVRRHRSALGLFFRVSHSFGDTYGPLAGIVALAAVVHALGDRRSLFGGAVAAQLEAVRAGRREPQDEAKVEQSEPDATPSRARSPA